ncbi:MAG TPA: hypothetical protein DDZ80_11105 [Cyanobacteria bacterium UBA8803]|nr:hypothetical protein [Cyanobacteria bacterium UBA9273]HBL59039.1 hypothetical protein [Cyanobacteria bacterium UBA8803]
MNKKLALILLSSPTVFGSMLSVLMTVNPVRAAEPIASVHQSCSSQPAPHGGRLTCARLSQTTQVASNSDRVQAQTVTSDETPMLEFTEEDSELALNLFGCDCPVCINAIRQMRGLPPVF